MQSRVEAQCCCFFFVALFHVNILKHQTDIFLFNFFYIFMIYKKDIFFKITDNIAFGPLLLMPKWNLIKIKFKICLWIKKMNTKNNHAFICQIEKWTVAIFEANMWRKVHAYEVQIIRPEIGQFFVFTFKCRPLSFTFIPVDDAYVINVEILFFFK